MKIFLSYSHQDVEIATQIKNRLEGNPDYLFDVWVDRENILPGRAWRPEIQKNIDVADIFLFIMCINSLKSDYCHLEIDYALQSHKRIIPLLIENLNKEQLAMLKEMPYQQKWTEGGVTARLVNSNWRALKEIQWQPFYKADKWEEAFANLLNAILINDEYVTLHTKLASNATDWRTSSKKQSYLLRGDTLEAAEKWFQNREGKSPQPTPLQMEYIYASVHERDVQNRRRLQLIAGFATLMLIILLLVGGIAFSLNQSNIHLRHLNIESSRVAALGVRELLQVGDLAGAYKSITSTLSSLQPSDVPPEAIESLRQIIPALSVYKSNDTFLSAQLSPDNEHVLISQTNGQLTLWNWRTCEVVNWSPSDNPDNLYFVAFQPSNRDFIVASSSGIITLWNMDQVLSGKTEPRQILSMNEHMPAYIMAVVFSPDSRYLAVASSVGIYLFDVLNEYTHLDTLITQEADSFERDDIFQLSFAPGGRLLALSNYGQLTLWNVPAEIYQAISIPPLLEGDAPTAVIASPEGRNGWIRTNYSTFCSWSLIQEAITDEDCLPAIEPQATSFSMALTPTGEYLVATGQKPNILSLRRIGQPQETITNLYGHVGMIYTIDVNDQYVVTTSDESDRTIRIWDWQQSLKVVDKNLEALIAIDETQTHSIHQTCDLRSSS